MTMLEAGVAILVIAFGAVGFLWVLPAWRGYRGKRVVRCPESEPRVGGRRRGRRGARRGLRVGRPARRPAEGLLALAGEGRTARRNAWARWTGSGPRGRGGRTFVALGYE